MTLHNRQFFAKSMSSKWQVMGKLCARFLVPQQVMHKSSSRHGQVKFASHGQVWASDGQQSWTSHCHITTRVSNFFLGRNLSIYQSMIRTYNINNYQLKKTSYFDID